jgi:thymidylate kinase
VLKTFCQYFKSGKKTTQTLLSDYYGKSDFKKYIRRTNKKEWYSILYDFLGELSSKFNQLASRQGFIWVDSTKSIDEVHKYIAEIVLSKLKS